jgi:lipopolysaccharide export system protein LptA
MVTGSLRAMPYFVRMLKILQILRWFLRKGTLPQWMPNAAVLRTDAIAMPATVTANPTKAIAFLRAAIAMPVTVIAILLSTIAVVTPVSALRAQERSLLRVISADRLDGRLVGDMELRELVGNVRLQQDNVFITCDRATQNITRNSAQLSGNVVITQDTLTLKTQRGTYDGDTRSASSNEGIYINDGHLILQARVGSYRAGTKIAEFTTDVTVEDTAATITSSRMQYVRDSALIVAWEKVRIRFKDENALITADSVRHYSDLKRTFFYNAPKLWQIDTAYVSRVEDEIDSLDLDTLSIVADRMEARRDSSNSFFTEGDVRIVRSGLSALCDEAAFLRSDSLMILRGKPVLWYDENQITGDSIATRVVGSELRALDVIGNAFSISRSKPSEQDSLYPPGRFDQTKGKRIRMQFAEKKPSRIRVEENAISLYYLYDETALNGVRKESSDLIILDFLDGKVKTIRSIRGVEGTYYPEKYVNGKESSYNLDGFNWRIDRPLMPVHPDIIPEHPDITPANPEL